MTHRIRRSAWAVLSALLTLAPSWAAAQGGDVRLHALTSTPTTFTGNSSSVELTTKGAYGSLLIDINGAIGGGSTLSLTCLGNYDGAGYVARAMNGPYPATTEDSDGAVTVTGQYSASIAGCQKVKVSASAWGTGSPVVTLTASSLGGSSGGGSGGGGAVTNAGTFAVQVTQGGNTAAVNASSQLSVTCANCSGSGVSVLEDVLSANGDAGTPAYSVRNDTLTSASSTDGDYQPLKSNAAGALYTADTYAGVVASTGVGASGAQTPRVVTATDSTIGTVTAVTTVSTVTNVATIGTSVTPGVAAGNLGKAEDAVAASADTGVMALGVRADTAAATGANGDYVPFLVDSLGRQWISGGDVEDAVATAGGTLVMAGTMRLDTAASSAGASGDNANFLTDALGKLWVTASFAEDTAHTDGHTGSFILGIRRDTTPTSSSGTAGDYSAINVDANGRVYTNTTLYDAAGAALTPATDKAEDAAHVSGDTGPVMMTRRIDTPATSSGTSGDYSTLDSSAEGAVYTTPIATGATSAGALGCAVVSAASTNSTNCKAAAGNVYGMYLLNTTTTVYYLRIYNSSSAPTCSSATGFIQSWPVPPAGAAGQTGGFSFSFPTGRAYTTGISYCLTAGSSSTDNTNAAVGIFGEVLYR